MSNVCYKIVVNPFTDEQKNLFAWHRAKTSLSFKFTFYILFRMQNEQLAGFAS